MYIEGDVPVVQTGSNCNGNNGFGWGGDWIWAFLIFALLGWGGNGFGGGYGNRGGNGGGGVMDAYVLNSDFATLQRQIDSGFAGVTSGITNVNNGLCSGFYEVARQFGNTQMQIASEFRNVDNAVCNLGYQTQAGFNSLGAQLAQCCCEQKQIALENRYISAQQTCDIKQSIADSTNAILGYLTTEKISALQAENAGLKAQISNDKQSAYLVDKLSPKCPIPAFLTCNPYTGQSYTNGYGYNTYGGNSGCCGCNG